MLSVATDLEMHYLQWSNIWTLSSNGLTVQYIISSNYFPVFLSQKCDMELFDSQSRRQNWFLFPFRWERGGSTDNQL